MNILYFFESIRNPVLDWIMLGITYFGSEIAFLAFAMTIFWCFDKNKGYYLMTVGFIGVVINQFLKIVCAVPRPWIKDPAFTTAFSLETLDAGGYSFPSGHAQNATGTYGGIARFTRLCWLRIVCIVLMVLVPVSRMYLGVHTPQDVCVSLLIGLILVFALYPLFELAKRKPKLMYWLLGGFFLTAIALTLFAYCFPFADNIDPDNLFELRKNACTLIGATGGVFVFYPIERKYINFSEKAPLAGQIVKVAVGMGVVMGVKEGLKAVFKLCAGGEEYLWIRSVRYFVVVAVAMAIYPLLFRFFAHIGEKKAEDEDKTSSPE